MWQNQSYIFFREIPASDPSLGPPGAQQVPLTPLRSLAVDRAFWASEHRSGSTPMCRPAPAAPQPLRRLLIAQDTGSAIKGRVRGDVFWGTGEAAATCRGPDEEPRVRWWPCCRGRWPPGWGWRANDVRAETAGCAPRYSVPDYGLWREIARQIKPLRPHRETGEEPAKPEPAAAAKARRSRGRAALETGCTSAPAAGTETGTVTSGPDRHRPANAAAPDPRRGRHRCAPRPARRVDRDGTGPAPALPCRLTGPGASAGSGDHRQGRFALHQPHFAWHQPLPQPRAPGPASRLVLEWLNEPEFRTHVSGFQPAHPRHGGGGALYVRLRRPKGHAD
jgi:hypothetical protein